MARMHPLVGLLLLSAALAGCVAAPGGSGGGAGDGGSAAQVQRLGGWANPDVPVVDVAAGDLTADGHPDLVVAQENGSVTVLDLANRSTHLQVDVGVGVRSVATVGGERGPAVAVVRSNSFGTYGEPTYLSIRGGTELSLINASSGETIAARTVDEIHADAVVADDLDGDGFEDLLLAGRASDPFLPLPYRDLTEVALVDGRFERVGYDPLWGDDDDAVRWRHEIDGRLVELGPVVEEQIPVATDSVVAAFDSVGHELWTTQLDGIVDLDADGVGPLAVAADGAARLGWNRTHEWTTNLTGGAAGILDGPGGRTVIVEQAPGEGAGTNVSVSAHTEDGSVARQVTLDATGMVADLVRVELTGHGTTAAIGLVGDNGTQVVFLGADLGPRAGVAVDGGTSHDRLLAGDVVPTGLEEAVLVGYQARLHVLGQR